MKMRNQSKEDGDGPALIVAVGEDSATGKRRDAASRLFPSASRCQWKRGNFLSENNLPHFTLHAMVSFAPIHLQSLPKIDRNLKKMHFHISIYYRGQFKQTQIRWLNLTTANNILKINLRNVTRDTTNMESPT